MKNKKKRNIKRSLGRKILNAFIGIFGFLIFLFILFLGYSQTESFHKYLKNKIIEYYEDNFNGSLNIQNISGSLFTSLRLKGVKLSVNDNNLFTAEKIGIRINPILIFKRTINFTAIELENCSLNILQDSTKRWNIDLISLNKHKQPEKPDSNGQSRTALFNLNIDNLNLINFNFTLKDLDHLHSDSVYSSVNWSDIRVANLNLNATVFANFNKPAFNVILNHFEAVTNTKTFRLKQLSGFLYMDNKELLADNLALKTDSSNIELTARMNDLNIFKMPPLKSFKNFPVKLKLNTNSFNFSDLATFIPSVNFLKGKVKTNLITEGTFGNLKIKKLSLNYLSTKLNATGIVSKLNTPERLFLNIRLINSKINEGDALRLMPEFNLPDFNDYSFSKVNVQFKGEPTNFFAKFSGKHQDGNLNLKGKLNLNARTPSYNFRFTSSGLNLDGILNSPTSITAQGTIKGRGFNPNKLNASLEINALNSRINNYILDSLKLVTTASAKSFVLDLSSLVNGSKLNVKGSLDLRNEQSPSYNLRGLIDSLNLSNFTNNKKLNSDLNFSFEAKGRDLRLDSMNASFKVVLINSMLRNHYLEDSDLKLALNHRGNRRKIKLTSDFIDLDLSGNFSLQNAISLLTYQSNSITYLLKRKFGVLQNRNVNSSDSALTYSAIDSIAYKPISFSFSYKIKDFEPIAILLDADEFDIAGGGEGNVNNTHEEFNVNANFNLDYLMNAKKNSIIYFSNLNADFHFSRNNKSRDFNDLFGSVSFEGDKIFVGDEFTNISTDIVFNQSKLMASSSFNLNNSLTAALDGTLSMNNKMKNISINNFLLAYKNIGWTNDSTIIIDISNDTLQVKKFSLKHKQTIASVKGRLIGDSLSARFSISDLRGSLINKLFLGKNKNKEIQAAVNIKGTASGSLKNPSINISLKADSVGIQNNYFGRLASRIKIQDGILLAKADFNDLKKKPINPILQINASYPLITENKNSTGNGINLRLISRNFELEPLSNIIPLVKDIKGKLNANISIKGKPANLKYFGTLKTNGVKIKLFPNNLTYQLDASVSLKDSLVKINNVSVSNTDDVPRKGKLITSGKFILLNNKVKDIEIISRGSLAILSKGSRSVSPNFYGDLFLRTDRTLKLKRDKGRLNLSGKIKIDNANIIVTPKQASTTNTSNIIYNFVEDTSRIKFEEKKFKKYLASIIKRKRLSAKELPFDFNLFFEISNEAKIELLLSKIWNQKLVMLVKGDVDYLNKNGITHAQGTLKLQNGSRFEFIKTFDARGSINFESDISNPYLDVEAMYVGNYNRGTIEHPDFIDVGVLFKLNGTLDKIGTNLINNPENIAVYLGSQNIQNKVKDNRYDFSDALLFIYLGRFKEDLTAKDKSKLAGLSNTATSFLGSAITSIVNSAVGDVVSDIQVNQAGQATRITISGRFQNIHYSIGGSTQIQNINEANVKIEYQLLPNLILRLERKNPVIRSFGVENKISELGLKYLWEF